MSRASSAPVAVAGMGAICSLGSGLDAIGRALAVGATGIRPTTRFDELGPLPMGAVEVLPAEPAGLPLTHRLAVAAAREAITGLAIPAADRIGVVVGTTTGGIAESARWYADRTRSAEALRWHPVSTVGHAVADAVGATGPRLTISTACSSGANAIATAAAMLRAGVVDLAIAGGADALCDLTLDGFGALRLVSADPCRPFDRERCGLNLGEAGAMVALVRRCEQPLAWLSGSACTCDAHHVTAPAPDGRAVIRAMELAIAGAGLTTSDIGYVNAHGTATPANDVAEAAALEAVFGAGGVPVSASKSFLGHTLGAAGAIEAVVTILALRQGMLPATVTTSDPLPGVDLVGATPRSSSARHAMSTSFAFGGNNAALVFSREAP